MRLLLFIVKEAHAVEAAAAPVDGDKADGAKCRICCVCQLCSWTWPRLVPYEVIQVLYGRLLG